MPSLGEDFALVQQALRHYRALTVAFRYGGLLGHYQMAGAALEALERIRAPQLPGMQEVTNEDQAAG